MSFPTSGFGAASELFSSITNVDIQSPPQNSQSTVETYFDEKRNFLLYNPFSSFWSWSKFKASPEKYPIYYVLGILGYTFSLPIRITIVVATVVQLISSCFKTLFRGDFLNLKNEITFNGLVLLGSIGELVSCIIGIACPVIAYKFDEWIQTNQTIHDWYGYHRLSFWFFEVMERPVQEGDVGIGLSEGDELGNVHKVNLKKKEIKSHLTYLKKARKELEEFIDPGQVTTVVQKVAALGFLHALVAGKDVHKFIDGTTENCDQEQGRQRKENLKRQLEIFETYFKALVRTEEKKRPFFGKIFGSNQEAGGDQPLSSDEFVAAVKSYMILGEQDVDFKIFDWDEKWNKKEIDTEGMKLTKEDKLRKEKAILTRQRVGQNLELLKNKSVVIGETEMTVYAAIKNVSDNMIRFGSSILYYDRVIQIGEAYKN